MSHFGTRRRAVIVGGSLGGLFTGLHLLRRGWEVSLHERVPVPLSGRGAGIVTHAKLFEALRGAGLEAGDGIGVPTPGRVVLARDGGVVARRDLPQILTSWGRMYELLGAAFPADRYRRGENFSHYVEDGDGVTAYFDQADPVRCDLLVGADGFRSSIRAQFDARAKPLYAGYVAWRGMVEEAELSASAQREMFPYFAFCLPEGEQILGYPVAGEGNDVRPGKRRYNFVWYRPADSQVQLPRLLTDRDGVQREYSIAPTMIRDEVIAEMRDAAQSLLSPQFAELVSKTAHPFIQPIYDLAVARMARGRIALVGDSAFVGRPHCGMGVTKAAQDAAALAEVLDQVGDIPAALERFDARRRTTNARVVDHARALGAYMQAQILSPSERENAERHRSPEAVMRETATADFLHETIH
ncbi:MAG: FAD binding domain-containing protein [Mesorhizobium sp.]|nr:FAD binding domain-containing protein [Mesorhizobium sp.]MCO5160225.1 FAD binding domain-containing protein [Mesorhizobium sp.]